MRSIVFFILVAVPSALLGGCRGHGAYGPPSDERLEAAVSDPSRGDGREVANVRCNEVQQKLREAKLEDKAETDRLQQLVDLFGDAKDRFGKLEQATARNPDLLYTAQSATIKANLEECRDCYADVRSELDRYVRELAELPIIQEVHGSKTVNVARIDFDAIRGAIDTLDPEDRDTLLGKIDAAEKKVGPKPAPPAKAGASKRR